MSDSTKVAEWLVIGFVKHWRMGQITSALGVDLEDDAAMMEFSNAYPFLRIRNVVQQRYVLQTDMRALLEERPDLILLLFSQHNLLLR